MSIHIYAPAGYYHIQHNRCLVWFDLTGWHEPNPVLWRKSYERKEKFVLRCRQYVKFKKELFLSHEQGNKILMKNIREQMRIEKELEKEKSQ